MKVTLNSFNCNERDWEKKLENKAENLKCNLMIIYDMKLRLYFIIAIIYLNPEASEKKNFRRSASLAKNN